MKHYLKKERNSLIELLKNKHFGLIPLSDIQGYYSVYITSRLSSPHGLSAKEQRGFSSEQEITSRQTRKLLPLISSNTWVVLPVTTLS